MQSFTYALSGIIGNCASVDGPQPSGIFFAGSPTGTITGTGPFPTGVGGCGFSTSVGMIVIEWSTSLVTVISYTASGPFAALALQGSVVADAVVNGVVYTTTEFPPGGGFAGYLTFRLPTALGENCATIPVDNAAFTGLYEASSA
jgi:hypothetical protein